MTTVILIRHGESAANRNNIFAGHIDPDLEENGVHQAKLTAQYIAENYQVDTIYSSDLTRAYKTARCLAELVNLPVTKEPGMREINAGKWEGVTFSDLGIQYPEEYDLWIRHIGKSRCTGGESVRELGERIFKTLTKIAQDNEGKTVAVATHATPIRTMMSMVETGGVDEMENIPWVSNASVTVFTYEAGKWTLDAASLDEHLTDCKTILPKNV